MPYTDTKSALVATQTSGDSDKSKQLRKAMTDVEPERIYVDQGYRGHDYAKKERVFITRQRRGLTPTIKRELRRRSAIEPMIGHMKADGRLGTQSPARSAGDAISAAGGRRT